jgi:uncharacterized membrane protein
MGLQYSFLMPRASLPLMPRNTDVDDSGADAPKLTFFQRLRYTMVKPDDDGTVKSDEPVLSREELEATIARADDKERNIGLVAAPIGAIVALFVSADLIHHAQQTGQSTSEFQTLTYVLLGMSVLLLAMSWLRKRLFIGIAMVVIGGAWYLVRAWRLQAKLKLAGGGSGATYGPPNSKVNRLPSAGGVLPRPSKRYTPPTEKAKRPSRAKPEA